MIDPAKLLEQFLGAGAGVGQGGFGQGGVPARQENQAPAHRGPWGAPVQSGLGGGTGDLLATARDYLGQHGGGVAGGAVAGVLTSLLLGSKGGRKLATSAAQIGAVAVLGGLAYKAYTNYREGKPVLGGPAAAEPPVNAPATLPGAPPPNEHAVLLLRSMIAAAVSDGMLDDAERQLILGRLADVGIGGEERAFLDTEIARPWSPAQFAAAAPTPEMRSEVYLAATLAIDADTDAERAYLQYLAATLRLEPALVAHLEATASAARRPALPGPQ